MIQSIHSIKFKNNTIVETTIFIIIVHWIHLIEFSEKKVGRAGF